MNTHHMEERHGPGKKGTEGKGSVSSCRSVGLSCCVDLTASANPSQGIKHARAHEADEAKHRDLEVRVVVDSLPSRGAFEDLALGARVRIAATFQGLLWVNVCHEDDSEGDVVTEVLSPPTRVLMVFCTQQAPRGEIGHVASDEIDSSVRYILMELKISLRRGILAYGEPTGSKLEFNVTQLEVSARGAL